MESLKERLLEHARWHDKHGCAASAVLLREASEALGVSPPADDDADDGNFTIGGEPWTDEQVEQMRATALEVDLRNARVLLEANGFIVSASSGVSPSGGWEPLTDVIAEMQKAAIKFPDWPTRGTDAAAIVAEECGELQRAVLQVTYERGDLASVRKEAIQTAAMALQFLLNLPDTRFERGEQAIKRIPAPPASPSLPREGEKTDM